MRKGFTILAFLVFIISACTGNVPTSSVNITPTITAHINTTTPVVVASSTPFFTSVPTLTPTITWLSTASTILPPDWKLDGYQEVGSYSFYAPLYEKYWVFWDRPYVHRTGYGWYPMPEYVELNGHKLRAIEIRKDQQITATISVSIDNAPVLSIVCDNRKSEFWANLIAYWAYDNHWLLEYYCNETEDIILDGVSLNWANGYSNSFSPYLVSGKLFFFFKRGNQVGFYYDGKEYLLDFDDISYAYCCGIAELNPEFYSNKLTFMGLRGETRYYAIMGNLDLP